MTTTIRPIRAGEETRLAAVLADALADDRFIRWIAGEDHARAVTWMRAGIKLARRHGLVLAYEPRGSPGASRARVSLALMTATARVTPARA